MVKTQLGWVQLKAALRVWLLIVMQVFGKLGNWKVVSIHVMLFVTKLCVCTNHVVTHSRPAFWPPPSFCSGETSSTFSVTLSISSLMDSGEDRAQLFEVAMKPL